MSSINSLRKGSSLKYATLIFFSVLISSSLVGVKSAHAIAQGDGILFYASTTDTTPRFRTYTASTNNLSAAGATVANAQPIYTYIRNSPIKQESVAGYQDTSGNLHVLCYDGTTWLEDWTVAVAPAGTPTTQRFSIAYETATGDVTVAYSRNTAATNAVDYRTKAGSVACGSANWSGANSFPTGTAVTTGTVHWIKSVSDNRAGQNLQGWIWADSNADLGAAIWDGTQFTNFKQLETSLEVITTAQDTDDFDLQYSSNTALLMVIWANSAGNNGTNGARYNTCTGGTSSCTWLSVAVDPDTGVGDDVTDLDLAANPDPTSDEMSFVAIGNAGSDLTTAYWSGSAWTWHPNEDAATETPAAGLKRTATGWLKNGANTKWYIVYDDSTGAGISWYYYITTGAATKPADYTSAPLVDDIARQHYAETNPFNSAEAIVTIADQTSGVFAFKLSMDGSGNLAWSNMTTAISWTTSPTTFAKGFDFQYFRYMPLSGGATVITQSASSITDASVMLNGTISDIGGSNPTVRGFAYGTNSALVTTIATTSESGSFSAGAYTSSVSSLSCNTTYYVRAYATNTAGTTFGSIQSFNTSACTLTVPKIKFVSGKIKFTSGKIKIF